MELNKATYISSSSGYVAKIDYSGKGWLSGKKNSFNATLYHENNEKETLYTIEGQWSEGFAIKEGSKKHGGTIETFNHKSTPTTKLQVAPVEQQDPLEANKAWKLVKEGILAGNMDTVHIEKSKIENSQREMRKREQAEGREWERRYFNKVPSDSLFEKLARPVGEKIEAEKTGGIWRFKREMINGGQAQAQTQAQAPMKP